MKEKLKVFSNGLLKENPSLRLVLGTCPALAVTTLAVNGLGMGLAATFVLAAPQHRHFGAAQDHPRYRFVCPAYITVIATFVTVLQMLVKAFVPALDSALGIFLPLIVVNCIILGRAEMFASKNSIGLSALDGLGMGLGFPGNSGGDGLRPRGARRRYAVRRTGHARGSGPHDCVHYPSRRLLRVRLSDGAGDLDRDQDKQPQGAQHRLRGLPLGQRMRRQMRADKAEGGEA